MSEVEWRAIPGYEGCYEISSNGEVKSLPRISARGQAIGGHLLRAYAGPYGYSRVNLHRMSERSNKHIHRLVLLAFIGPRPDGCEALHADGNSLNNALSNLSYGTKSDNMQDALKHGTHANAAKTYCKHGHAFTEANTYWRGSKRDCRTCTDVRRANYRARRAVAA